MKSLGAIWMGVLTKVQSHHGLWLCKCAMTLNQYDTVHLPYKLIVYVDDMHNKHKESPCMDTIEILETFLAVYLI